MTANLLELSSQYITCTSSSVCHRCTATCSQKAVTSSPSPVTPNKTTLDASFPGFQGFKLVNRSWPIFLNLALMALSGAHVWLAGLFSSSNSCAPNDRTTVLYQLMRQLVL